MNTISRACEFVRPLALVAAGCVRCAGGMVGVAGVMVACGQAVGAVTSVAPYSVTPAKGEVKVRSGAGGVWYAVASVKPGTLLRVDGESEGWLRVAYLPGMAAVVKASDAEKRADGSVVLTRPSALSGLDMADPSIEACYKGVLDEKLPSGVSLKYLGDVTDRSGKVDGYRVEAPAGARGWVATSEVKKVSDAEAAKSGGAAPAVNQGAAPKIVVPAPTGAPAVTPGNPPPNPAAGTPPVPVESMGGTPAPTESQPETAATEPVATPEPVVIEPPKPREPTPEEIRAREIAAKMQSRAAKLATLDDAYRVVTSQPVESAEIEPLIGEYERFKSELGSDPMSARQVVYVKNRIDLLRLRTDLQDRYRSMAELRAKADQTMANINAGVQAVQNSRQYLVVGRLTTSAMYDGARLPLLYRVQSVDQNVARTLAYVTPEQGQQLEMKLGMIVGVKGDGPFDPSSKVNVLVPTQVDILKNADGTPMTVPGGAAQ